MTAAQNAADAPESDVAPADSLSLSVALLSAPAKMGKWEYQKTGLAAVAPCADSETGRAILSTSKNGGRVTLWRGQKLRLYKESCESYWANMNGESPKLFVACRREENETRPVCITASGEEAAGFGEVDDEIVSAPMPAWIVDAVERFVVAHYRPQKKKVRRRE